MSTLQIEKELGELGEKYLKNFFLGRSLPFQGKNFYKNLQGKNDTDHSNRNLFYWKNSENFYPVSSPSRRTGKIAEFFSFMGNIPPLTIFTF